jgi:hypothetical protein
LSDVADCRYIHLDKVRESVIFSSSSS